MEKWSQNHFGQIPEQPALSSITNRHRIGRRFLDCCARHDAIAAEDHSYIAKQGEQRPMDQRDDYQEAKRTCERLYEEHGKGNTRLHPKDQVRRRRSQQFTGTKEGSTIHQQVLHLQVGKHFHGGNLHHGMSDIFQNGLKVFSLTVNGDSLVSDREGVHRTPNPQAMSRSRTRDLSRAVFHSLSLTCITHACGSSHSGVLCSQSHLSSHLAQHGTQYTFSDVSAIIEHFLTTPSHSNPPFDQTINGTSAGFIF